jgi:hypothetical protein
MSTFPLEAHQNSISLALLARQAYARGCELRGVNAEEAEEAFLEAWDHAREAGVVCGKHQLPLPFGLIEVPALMAAFVDGGGESMDPTGLAALLDVEIVLLARAA